MEDLTRCFPVPPLAPLVAPTASVDTLPNRQAQFRNFLIHISSQCWAHYENGTHHSNHHHDLNHRHLRSIYLGSLGTCSFVRYRLAKSLSWSKNRQEQEEKLQLLLDGLKEVDAVLNSYPQPSSSRQHSQSQCRMKITLLEGERVGALSLRAALFSALEQCPGREFSAATEVRHAKCQLLEIGNIIVKTLPRGECEVLYGRAGYLQAIAFVRSETKDDSFGESLVKDICKSVLDDGAMLANRRGVGLPFLWEWYGEMYLGAAHGVVGILFTLLCFKEEIASIQLDGEQEEETLGLIEDMLLKLDEMCFDSGNLKPSLDDCEESDRLVHFCHGAPGHILLLVKAYEVYNSILYLEKAEKIAHTVLCRRGLLRKGVGLCHGIAGNAYCFLSLYRGRKLEQTRTREQQQNQHHNLQTNTSSTKSVEWLQWANHFASFAVDHFNDLKWIPDHPYSLYEGAAGLIMLLHDLENPDYAYFPCFEIGM